MKIGTNIPALQAQRRLSQTTKAFARALERLSSGKRINRAGDDASGLAIATGLESQTRALNQVIRNINDSTAYLETASGAMATQINIVQRIRELAIQAANGSLGNSERSFLNTEAQQLLEEFQRIASSASFNGVNLLDGSLEEFRLQVGINKGDEVSFGLSSTQTQDVFVEYEDLATGTSETAEVDSQRSDQIFNADINNDGHEDIVSRNAGTGEVIVLLGDGAGTFEEASRFTDTQVAIEEIRDYNGDGNLDLAMDDGSHVKIYSGDGSGSFELSDSFSFGNTARFAGSLDLDGDGDEEIIISEQTGGVRNYIYDNDGENHFDPSQSSGFMTGLKLGERADVDGDGDEDLVLSRGIANTAFGVYLNNGDGTVSGSSFEFLVLGSPTTPKLSDIDNDGDVDAVVQANDSLAIYKNDGVGNFTRYGAIQSISSDLGEHQLADIDNDGDDDALFFNQVSGEIFIYENDGNGSFTASQTLASSTPLNDIRLADYTGDGSLDILASSDDGGLRNFVNDGQGGFVYRTDVSTGISDGNNLVAEDYNGDGITDFLQSSGSGISLLLTNTRQRENFAPIDLSTQSRASDSLEVLDRALDQLLERQAQVGSLQSRLDISSAVSAITRENLEASRSQIIDTEIAKETAELTKQQILQQASSAVLAQANSNLRLVLSLLDF